MLQQIDLYEQQKWAEQEAAKAAYQWWRYHAQDSVSVNIWQKRIPGGADITCSC